MSRSDDLQQPDLQQCCENIRPWRVHLSKRLAAVVGMVPAGSIAADIGTDHGYIPAYLVAEGICPSAFAMDINPGPLERAGQTVKSCGLEEKIALRLSDGLQRLEPGEADTLIIAGMGGGLMIQILAAHPEVLEAADTLILAPQSEIAKVRRWISAHHFHITDEDMVLEDGKYYQIIRADKCAGNSPEAKRELTDLQARYGPVLLQRKHPVLASYLQFEYRIKEEILAGLQKNAAGHPKVKEIEDDLARIRQAGTCFS